MQSKRFVTLAASLALATTLIAGAFAASWDARPARASAPSGELASAFASAAQQYGVPQQLLMAISYSETHWNAHLATSPDNGDSGATESVYGPMSLYLDPDGSGTVAQAAADLGVSVAQVETDPTTNIAGAAAVLVDDSKTTNNGKKPPSNDVNQWYGAVAKYVGNDLYEPAKWFANDVYALMQSGVDGVATDGERLSVPAQAVNPATSQIDILNLTHLQPGPSDYPNTDEWIPSGGKHYGASNRPKNGLFVQYIVIHDTEEDYPGTIRTFRNPGGCCSANYVVDGEAGGAYPAVTQLVHNKDIAYHAGNYWVNQHSIGIEHVGFADAPNGYYTQKLYDASAQLVAYLCAVYNIPIDRAHILGHGSVPGPSQVYTHGMHWDPGPFWDWAYYLNRVRYYYAQWTSGTPAVGVPAQYQTSRTAIRAVAVNAAHDGASDIPSWTGGTYTNFANVTTTPGGSTLVKGASDPSTWVTPSDYNAADFSCDNLPDATQNSSGVWTEDTNSDLRAKSEYQQAFALLNQTTVNGVTYDEIDFNGTPGWVSASDTADSWGAIVTFGGSTTVYGQPTLSSGHAICDDASNGFSRVGQSYVSQNIYTDPASGITWYEIYYNHRIAWVPNSEVTVS
jgi:N-acetyl-anhydromuramyl-L-alanine amidase AmpD